MKKRVLALLAVSLLMLTGLILAAKPGELSTILGSAAKGMIALSIISYTLAIAVFALIWRLLLKATGLRLSLTDNFRLVFSAVFFNVVTPTASYGGEAVRAYLLTQKFKQDAGSGVATIVAHRIIGTISNALGTLGLGLYLILFYSIPTLLLLVIAVVSFSSFFGFLIFLYFGLRIEWSKKVVKRVIRLIKRFRGVGEGAEESVYATLDSYHFGLQVLLKSRKVLLFSLILGLVAWFLVNLVAVFSFLAVGGQISLENFLLIFTFFSVARLIPTGLPEFVGSKEVILAALYAVSGLDVSTSIAVIILIRVATQLWMIVFGGLITLQIGLEDFRNIS